ncbi:hypothetical protein GPECTOR_8g187 [Gonium pectorale]|uniref:Cytosolic carboxypeptidase-like protein 5 n=1 Tax=Gonium pectorale TaxID=33097 RepID=A0A150GTX3_GONPE|nr:hypothetical protein GPECTOR_8g187 [Gonium pectorale]|eukprot:KXZ52800.1 hypothetical protein GPECTOR_8g187 [Gonium pectorale]
MLGLEQGFEEDELLALELGVGSLAGLTEAQKVYKDKIKEKLAKRAAELKAEDEELKERLARNLELGKRAYECGEYPASVRLLEQAVRDVGAETALGGEAQLWLGLAYQACGREKDAIELYKYIEDNHPNRKVRKQAIDLRYILEAPKLELSDDERVKIPLIQSDSWRQKEDRVSLDAPDPLALLPDRWYVRVAAAIVLYGKHIFRADFDSANLESVEPGFSGNEYLLRTQRDCEGTLNEKATRTWFYFSVRGHSLNELLIFNILNLNKQGRLYSQDYRPVFWSASQPEWQPLRYKVTYRREGDDFQLRFCHRFESEEETLFAFAIPFSYQQTQDMLDRLDVQLPLALCGLAPTERACSPRAGTHHAASSSGTTTGGGGGGRISGSGAHDDELYYRRQVLTHSVEGRRVEILTITDCAGATGELEPPLQGVFTHDPGPPAAVFRGGKTVFFVSSRVHPGETPATHMFNGMLAFLLRRSDPRAAALRRRFVFKLVPLVNPDGVAAGNYRTDTLGQNLNRFYNGIPDGKSQPSVYAIKTLLMYYAQQGLLEYYLDLHAHANKKGVFIYGNTLADGEAHFQSLLYSKLISMNSAAFDFIGCNYTEKNMSRPDKDGASKEGAGRVALYRETGLTHLYTVEANYNTARTLNVIAPAVGDHGGRASPPCNKRFPTKFTVSTFQAVGRAILVAALDMEGANPWSRLPHSEHRNLEGVRNWLHTVLRATPETRAAHLPPVSDGALEVLRGSMASGALRLLATAMSPGGGPGRRSSGRMSLDSPASSAIGYSSASSGFASSGSPISVAFGRSVSRLPQPAASPPIRRALGSLPVIGGSATSHGYSTTPSSRPPVSGGRRGAVVGLLDRANGDHLARSSSLPVRMSTASRTPQGIGGGGSGAGSRSATVSETGCGPRRDGSDGLAAAAEPPCEDGPSDEDGDDDEAAGRPEEGQAAGSSSRGGSERFRGMESPMRPTTVQTYKGTVVYCSKVTEFKIPLEDKIPRSHNGNGSSTATPVTPKPPSPVVRAAPIGNAPGEHIAGRRPASAGAHASGLAQAKVAAMYMV